MKREKARFCATGPTEMGTHGEASIAAFTFEKYVKLSLFLEIIEDGLSQMLELIRSKECAFIVKHTFEGIARVSCFMWRISKGQ
jgi:hypothetical protein